MEKKYGLAAFMGAMCLGFVVGSIIIKIIFYGR